MRRRYVVAPQAARDLAQSWRYLRKKAGRETADRLESVIRSKFAYLADSPDAGHWRHDLTLFGLFLPDCVPARNAADPDRQHLAR